MGCESVCKEGGMHGQDRRAATAEATPQGLPRKQVTAPHVTVVTWCDIGKSEVIKLKLNSEKTQENGEL